MKREIITTAIYYRKVGKKKVYITLPIKEVLRGVDSCCSAILKQSLKHTDGYKYYFACVNYTEAQSLINA